MDVEKLQSIVDERGAAVRKLKEEKADTASAVQALLAAKNDLAKALESAIADQKANIGSLTGDAKDTADKALEALEDRLSVLSGKKKKKKKNAKGEQPPVKSGPSKNDLKKAAKKAEKAKKKAQAKAQQGTNTSATVAPSVSSAPVSSESGGRVPVATPRFPYVASVASLYAKLPPPTAEFSSRGVVLGDHAMARHLVRIAPACELNVSQDAVLSTEWLDVALLINDAFTSISLDVLERHLTMRTYFVGYSVTLADAAVWGALRNAGWRPPTNSGTPNLSRWWSLCEALPNFAATGRSAAAAIQRALKNTQKSDSAKTSNSAPAQRSRGAADVGSCPALKGAEEGAVVTRFPPEPSGHLHIGHVKAIFLNAYYAERYGGKMLLRFDDTNPSKEKEEYEHGIIEDLKSLGVQPVSLSYTSDHFELIQGYAESLIKQGKAYMDDTPAEKMREERMDGIESKRRAASVEENLASWRLLLSGEGEGCCLRAKIDMQDKNKCMRDPVIFRGNATPHARTKTKYKAYPTYDLACPIVDSIEGVTHAMRDTQYTDREALYAWMLEAMKLRVVRIHAFSRLNFSYTLLSKRKLAWLVDQGQVEGWGDPRFPTVKGVLRRGMSVAALRNFMLAQGASRRPVDMEWDKFWAINKKMLDPIAPRFMAVSSNDHVELRLDGVDGVGGVLVAKHPKDPGGKRLGNKVVLTAPVVLLEREDVESDGGVQPDEELTLMRWTNVIVTEVNRNAEGKVEYVQGRLNLDGDFKSTKRKLCWVAQTDHSVLVNLYEFDHLVTKKRLEEGDNFQDFLNPTTMAVTSARGNAALRLCQEGDCIQLERRGYYRVDRAYRSAGEPINLFTIPDGKAKSMSNLSTKLSHR